MALIVADRVFETTTTTGTGALSLAGAVTGFRAFDDVCANNDTCYYSLWAVDGNGNPTGDWETGLGTFTDTDTLTRTTVQASSNSNNAVNLAAGTKYVQLSATTAYLATIGGTASGTSFPGSPASGDKYYRSDRSIEYFYDGTRWLSTQIFVLPLAAQDAVTPFTASGSIRATNPWFGVYDMYVERHTISAFSTTTTATNYFSCQLQARTAGAAASTIGSAISTQNITQNQWATPTPTTPNVVVASTVNTIEVLFTETGTSTTYILSTMQYRLVG